MKINDWLLYLSKLTNSPWVSPRQATIKVNSNCNSLCIYCYAWKEKQPKKELLLKEYLQLIDELSDLGIQTITFTGGEPLLRQDIEQMIHRAQQHNISTGVITNGLLLTPGRYDSLYEAGLRYFNISLDTIEPTIYKNLRGVSLERVISNILSISKKNQKSDAYITLICVISRLNLQTIPELTHFAFENKIRLMLQPVQSVTSRPTNKTDNHLHPWQFRQDDLPWVKETIHQLMENEFNEVIGNPPNYLLEIPSYLCRNQQTIISKGCDVCYTDINIDEELSLRPCWRLPSVGNLQEISLKDAWTSSAFARSRRLMKKGSCPSCWLLYRGH